MCIPVYIRSPEAHSEAGYMLHKRWFKDDQSYFIGISVPVLLI